MEPDEFGQDSEVTPEAPEAPETTQGNNQQQDTPELPAGGDVPEGFSGHPAWKPFEEALGPIQYRAIEPHLRSMNEAFESKIRAQNEQLKPWKNFIDGGVTPEVLNIGIDLLGRLNSDPVAVYRELEEHLRSTGQLEAAAQVAAAADQIEDEQDGDENPELKALREQVTQLTQDQQAWLQMQQEQMQRAQFEQDVEKQVSTFKNEVQQLENAGFDRQTIKLAIDRAELHYTRTGKPLSITDAAKQVKEELDVIRNQPRPVDRAPRLPGVSGGAPAPGTVDLAKASRQESVDTLAALISQAKG